MYALLYIGILLEPLLGYSRFTLAYLLTGLVSSVVSLWWHDFTVSAGASGAIFGMYGVFFALLLSKIIEPSARKQLLLSVSIFIGYNLLNGMKGGVDNAAHIGGLVIGFLIGLVYIFQLVKPGATSLKKYLSTALIAVVMIASAVMVVRSIPNDVPRYEANMQDFARKERLALEALNLPTTTPYEELVFQLKDRGLYYWDESLELLHKTERLSVPQPLRDRTKIFIKYCELRRSSYELMIKSLEERTDKYQEEISNYNEEIKDILVSLNGQ
jgi:rhomboid protease GluP